MTIDYDAGSLTGWCGLPCLLLRWRGTILHGAIMGPMFWLTLTSHVALLILGGRIRIPSSSKTVSVSPFQNGTRGSEGAGSDAWEAFDLPTLPWSSAVVGLTLLFFFTVFYGNASYARFYQLYGHCVGIGGTTMEWVSLVKAHSMGLAESARVAAQWNAVRLVLAATHLLYYTLHGENISEDEWKMIMVRDLLTEAEVSTLKTYKGFKPFIVLCWALELVNQMVAQAKASPNAHAQGQVQVVQVGLHTHELIMWQFREVVFKFRGHCGQIINLLKQPVPFPYFHLLNVIM